MDRVRVAVGDEKEWERYSAPKPVKVQSWPRVVDGRFTLLLEDVTWEVQKSCTVSRAYFIDEYGETLFSMKLDYPVHLRKRGLFTLTNTKLKIDNVDGVPVGPDGPCLV